MRCIVSVLVVLALSLAGCNSEGSKQPATNPEQHAGFTDSLQTQQPAAKISGTVADSLLNLLCRTWYSKRIVLNDLGEEYPTNNEELTLQRDMIYIAVDRVKQDSLAGTWQIITDKIIELTNQQGMGNRFLITEMTKETLVTKVLDPGEEQSISIHYSSEE